MPDPATRHGLHPVPCPPSRPPASALPRSLLPSPLSDRHGAGTERERWRVGRERRRGEVVGEREREGGERERERESWLVRLDVFQP